VQEQRGKDISDTAAEAAKNKLLEAQAGYYNARPEIANRGMDIRENKNLADEEYKSNLITLGKQKADAIKTYRDQIVELKNRGADQNDVRIRQNQQRIDDLAGYHKDIIAQRGLSRDAQNQRQQITIQAKQLADKLKQGNVVKNKALSAQYAAQLAKLKAQYDQLGVQSQDQPTMNATGEAVPNQ